MKENNREKITKKYRENCNKSFGINVEKLFLLLPVSIVGLIAGLDQTDEYYFSELKDDGLNVGLAKLVLYVFGAKLIMSIFDAGFLTNLAPLFSDLITNKIFIGYIISNSFPVSILTYPLFYKIGCGLKHAISRVSAGISVYTDSVKERKELKIEEKKEKERELSKDYIFNPVDLVETKKEVEPSIDDYKKLREEYSPSTSVVPEEEKVLGLK